VTDQRKPAEPDSSMMLLGNPMRKLSDGLWSEPWDGAAAQAAVFEDNGLYLAHYWVYRGHGKGQMVQVVSKKDRIKTAAEACARLNHSLSLVRDALTAPARAFETEEQRA
jgi:hypothetical protein